MNEFYEDAKVRMPSQKKRILSLLEQAGADGVSNLILNEISFRYADRIYQLKKEGYKIVTEKLNRETAKYRLISGENNEIDPRTALQVIMDEVNDTYNGQIKAEDLEKIVREKGLIVIRRANQLNKKAN